MSTFIKNTSLKLTRFTVVFTSFSRPSVRRTPQSGPYLSLLHLIDYIADIAQQKIPHLKDDLLASF